MNSLEATHHLKRILDERATKNQTAQETILEFQARALEIKAEAIRKGYMSISNPEASEEDQYRAAAEQFTVYTPIEIFVRPSQDLVDGKPQEVLGILHAGDGSMDLLEKTGMPAIDEDLDPDEPVIAFYLTGDALKGEVDTALIILPDDGSLDAEMSIIDVDPNEDAGALEENLTMLSEPLRDTWVAMEKFDTGNVFKDLTHELQIQLMQIAIPFMQE